MISGIGTDMVEIERIQDVYNRAGERFLSRVFTGGEKDYCSSRSRCWECYAGRFAAKEAVLKALGTGLSGCRFKDVEIAADPPGPPRVILHGGAERAARERGVGQVLLSITHEAGMALAFAVALIAKEGDESAGGNCCGNERNGQDCY